VEVVRKPRVFSNEVLPQLRALECLRLLVLKPSLFYVGGAQKRKLSNAKIAPISLSRRKPPLIGLQLYADQYSEEKGITFESLQ
jgi:hypothetical protein